MAHRSQCSSAGDNPLDPNYLPPHYREEYRMAVDALVEADLEGYYGFLQEADVVDFLARSELEYIKRMVKAPHHTAQPERRYMAEDVDGSSDTYWPVHSDHDAPSLDLGWPQHYRFVGPTEVTTLVNPSDPEMPSIKEQVRRMIKNAQQVIAVVMDMFTDVDIFADILGAATRGVAVYVLLDEINAHHFVAMVNNCRVNLDAIKFMRVRTVCGSTYYCRTGKTFKGQMMDRFILVDCRAVLSGNYSFMWSFEKIHRCLAHLFLGQLVTTFDEEFRILFAHSEPLVVENVLANMPHYGGEPESYYNTEKSQMFNRKYPTMGMEWAGRTTEDQMKLGYKMLPFRSESIHSASEANPSVQKHMNLHAAPQFRGDPQFIEHGRQMRGPNEMAGFKRHSYGSIPDYEYMPPQSHPTMRGNQYMEGAMPQGGQFGREPCIYQGAGLQSGYDVYGRFRGQGQHIDQFSGPGYTREGDEAEPPGAYDHIQRYLQSQPAMEEGHGPRNALPPVQSNLRRHSMGQSYACQTSPTQPNPPEQKRFFNASRKPQDVSQKQGLRDWRISSYLSAYDDAGELDLVELEGSSACDDIPCFTQEAPRGPVRAEIRPGNREFNRIPSPRENPKFVQIQNDSVLPDILGNPSSDLSQINIKTTPASTSESSCTTEGDKVEETQNREPKETSWVSEEFLKRKPSRPVQRSSRLRHSLIFSSNLELNTPEDMKDTAGEKDGDEASKLTARVSQILDKRRTGSPFQPFQWSSFGKSATFDNSTSESAQPEDELNKTGKTSDVGQVENCQNLRRNSVKSDVQEKDLPQTVPERNTQSPSNLLQKSSSFIDMNDPDCRLRYFKELAAKRKLATAKSSQTNPIKATQKFTLPEKPSTSDADKKTGPVFKTPETPLKSKNTTATVTEIKDNRCEESSKGILHRATDAEKIRFKKKLAEESACLEKKFKGDIDQSLKPVEEARTVSTSKNQTPPILKVDSVALNTTSAESGPKQYHIPKEIDPSHAVQTESCSPVKLPQTKCVSPLHTMPNEGSLSANDSQTLAQSLSNISSTCPDTVPLDYKSTSDLAIVDTCVPSKYGHEDTNPSRAFSTNGICSTQHPADSSQHLSETGADFLKHSTPIGAERSTTENAYSQHHSATEENSSQQYNLMEAGSTKPENKPSQKSTSAEADFSQHTPASKTEPTSLCKEFSLHPTATECGTSQKFPVTTEADSFQQPTAVESESLHHSTTIEAACSQPTETREISSHPPSKTRTDFCQQSTAAESEKSQQCTAVSSDFSKHPPAVRANSSEHPTAAEMGSSQFSTASVVDSTQHHMAKESTQPFIQPIAPATTSSQHFSAMETDSSQQPTATTADSSQHRSATGTNSSQEPTQMETHPSQKPIAVERDSSQLPTAAATESSLQSTTTVTDSPQQPNAIEANPSQKSIAFETGTSQQSTASMVDAMKQLTASEADTPQSHTATESDLSTEPFKQLPLLGAGSSQDPNATVTDSSQQPAATVVGSFQMLNAADKDSSQQSTSTDTDSSQQPIAAEIVLSQQPIETFTDSSLKSTSRDTDSSQQPTATNVDSSREITAADTDSSRTSTATEVDFSQEITAADTDSSKTSTATEVDFSREITAADTDSSKTSTATEVDSSREITAADTDSSQTSTATEVDSSQKITAADTDSSQMSTATEVDSSRGITAADTDSSQASTATEVDPSQETTSADTDSSQKSTATETDSCPEPIAAVTDTSQKSASTDTDSSQQPTATDTDSSQEPTAKETDSSQEPTAKETDSFQQPIATEDSFQELTAKDTDSFQQPVATQVDSSREPSAAETDSSPEPTAAATDTSQESTAQITDSSQLSAAAEIGSSWESIAADTDSSYYLTATDTDFSDTDSSQQLAATETDTSQKMTATTTDSFQQSFATEIDSSQQLTITESGFSQNPTKMETDTSKLPTETENEPPQDITTNKPEKKDENLTEAFSKVIPIPEVNITQKDNSISQNAVITDLSSSAEHSQSDTVTPCDSQVELNQTQAWAEPCVTPTVKHSDSGALTSLDSMEVSSAQPQGSPEPCLSSNEINSTQGIALLQSSLSSNPMESSCQNDLKPEKMNECQKSETITEQIQSHDTSAVDAGPKTAQIEVSTAIDSNEVDKIKQTTPEVENTVTNLAEVSEKSHMTVHSNSENQSSVAENAKPTMSAHQTSTANVISCSNLRDDTKVLLEQISAKNQSRSSQSKQTATPNEAKKGEVNSGDKLFSNYSGRPWTSKATPEEREILLQKMEQMRKERKVYSRFEAS
ncbi:serine-rich adhesin for platelets isoform X3 [Labeo rohita]|uniref:serine-rich adhesin for platelets isoform X3 n=1 Tax=Labeo rohita TaxID=84645 RepID=UPI0021E29B0F|nr:serine-rich adhesin for platelets isoform X3 [Labeo rohita]